MGMKKIKLPRYIRSQIASLKLAIRELEDARRCKYAAGHHAYRSGHRKSRIKGGKISGESFAFADEGEAHYQRYTKAMQDLNDMIEGLEDPGVTIIPAAMQPNLFRLEKTHE